MQGGSEETEYSDIFRRAQNACRQREDKPETEETKVLAEMSKLDGRLQRLLAKRNYFQIGQRPNPLEATGFVISLNKSSMFSTIYSRLQVRFNEV